mgnify:FL=1
MHFKQNCAYKDNKGNYWFVRWVDKKTVDNTNPDLQKYSKSLLTAGLLKFARPDYLPNDGFTEYIFDAETGEMQVPYFEEQYSISLSEDDVLDYNINNSLFDIIKNCWKRITTRPAEFKKFDMVRCLSFKEDGVIITKDELDNQFLIYYPFTGIRQWEHASDLEFVYRPTKPVRPSDANK